jgi:hypothetical protein
MLAESSVCAEAVDAISITRAAVYGRIKDKRDMIKNSTGSGEGKLCMAKSLSP